MKPTLEDICLESEAFYALVDEVVELLKGEEGIVGDPWVNKTAAMAILGIKSSTTLQKLRDEGKIRFTAPSPRKFLYERESIMRYLEEKAKNTF